MSIKLSLKLDVDFVSLFVWRILSKLCIDPSLEGRDISNRLELFVVVFTFKLVTGLEVFIEYLFNSVFGMVFRRFLLIKLIKVRIENKNEPKNGIKQNNIESIRKSMRSAFSVRMHFLLTINSKGVTAPGLTSSFNIGLNKKGKLIKKQYENMRNIFLLCRLE